MTRTIPPVRAIWSVGAIVTVLGGVAGAVALPHSELALAQGAPPVIQYSFYPNIYTHGPAIAKANAAADVDCLDASDHSQFTKCNLVGSASIKVSASTKKKLRLASTTVSKAAIKGTPAACASSHLPPGCGLGGVLFRVNSATSQKLRGVKQITATYTFTLTSPIRKTLKKTGPVLIDKRAKGEAGFKSDGS